MSFQDYELAASTPASDPEDAKLHKHDLVQEISCDREGWVLVKKMDRSSRIPGLLPNNLVAEVQPGFYRFVSDRVKHRYVKMGDIVYIENVDMGRCSCLMSRTDDFVPLPSRFAEHIFQIISLFLMCFIDSGERRSLMVVVG